MALFFPSSFVPAILSFNYKYVYLIPSGKRKCHQKKGGPIKKKKIIVPLNAFRIRIRRCDQLGFVRRTIRKYFFFFFCRRSTKWNPQTTTATVTYSNEWYNCALIFICLVPSVVVASRMQCWSIIFSYFRLWCRILSERFAWTWQLV